MRQVSNSHAAMETSVRLSLQVHALKLAFSKQVKKGEKILVKVFAFAN
jgi:hypothetical protein